MLVDCFPKTVLRRMINQITVHMNATLKSTYNAGDLTDQTHKFVYEWRIFKVKKSKSEEKTTEINQFQI